MRLLMSFLFVLNLHAVTHQEARDFCDKWLPALVKADKPKLSVDQAVTELLDKYYTQDAQLFDPNFELPVSGQLLKNYYLSIFTNYPAWSFPRDKQTIYPTSNGFVLEYYGTIPNALTGHTVENFRGVDIIVLEKIEGVYKIKSLKGYYDRKPFFPTEENE